MTLLGDLVHFAVLFQFIQITDNVLINSFLVILLIST